MERMEGGGIQDGGIEGGGIEDGGIEGGGDGRGRDGRWKGIISGMSEGGAEGDVCMDVQTDGRMDWIGSGK